MSYEEFLLGLAWWREYDREHPPCPYIQARKCPETCPDEAFKGDDEAGRLFDEWWDSLPRNQ